MIGYDLDRHRTGFCYWKFPHHAQFFNMWPLSPQTIRIPCAQLGDAHAEASVGRSRITQVYWTLLLRDAAVWC